MKQMRIAEFCLGVLTVIASSGNWILAVSSKNPLEWISLEWAFMFLIFTVFPVVVIAGSYGHAFLKRENGFYFLSGASLVMAAAATCLFVMIEISGGGAYGTDLILLLPPILAVFTAVTASLVRYFDTGDRITIGDTLDGLP
jgi:hypothetical protein